MISSHMKEKQPMHHLKSLKEKTHSLYKTFSGYSAKLHVVPHFSSGIDSRASEMLARVKITPREKRRHATERK